MTASSTRSPSAKASKAVAKRASAKRAPAKRAVAAPQETPSVVVELAFEQVALGDIVPARDNPRAGELGDLTELVASIREVGVVQALTVERCADKSHKGHRFHLVAGERRWTAAATAGLAVVPCVIRPAIGSDSERLALMIIENLQRQDVSPLAEGRAFARLVELGWSQHDIAKKLACTQAHVSKRIALLNLPDAAQKKLDNGGITVSAAQELLKLKDTPKAIEKIVKGNELNPERVRREVETAQREINAAAKKQAQVDEAKKRGWKVLRMRGYNLPDGFKRIAAGSYPSSSELRVDVAKHKKEPCHAIVIDEHAYGRTDAIHGCTDPARHKASKSRSAPTQGESALKVEPEKRREPSVHERREAERRKGRRLAAESRRSALPAILSQGISAASALEHLVVATIERSGAATAVEVAAILGLEGVKTSADLLRVTDAAGATTMMLAAVAIDLLDGHEVARSAWNAWGASVRRLYAFLEAHGYVLNEFERASLGEAAKSADSDEDDFPDPGEGPDLDDERARVIHLLCQQTDDVDEQERIGELLSQADWEDVETAELTGSVDHLAGGA